MKRAISLLSACFLAGCVGSGGGIGIAADIPDPIPPSISVTTDEFNDSKIVQMSPVGSWCHSPALGRVIETTLGFEYNTYTPDLMVVILRWNPIISSSPIISFLNLDIRINEERYGYETGRNYHDTGGTVSRVVIPYKVFEGMMTAEKTLLRISTSDGYSTCDFSMGIFVYDYDAIKNTPAGQELEAIGADGKKFQGEEYKMAKHYAKEFLQTVSELRR